MMKNPAGKNHNILVRELVLAGAFLFCCQRAIYQLAVFWEHSYIYSYGFLIPFISAYMVWKGRNRLSRIEPAPSYLIGLPLFLAGLFMLVIGDKGLIFTVQSLSIIVIMAGIILLLFGKRLFMAVLFPVGYLLLMVPVWNIFTDRLRMSFRLLTSFTASHLLSVAGVPVYGNSVFLELPNITLKVANECSGIDNLLAVLALALPLAYLSLRSWPRRLLLIAGGIAIAALSNSLRVALIGFLAYKGITASLHGPGHILAGMFVSFVGFIVLFMGAWALGGKKSGRDSSAGKEESGPGTGEKNSGKKTLPGAVLASVVCILIAFGSYVNFHHSAPVELKTPLESFPYEIGAFNGSDAPQGSDFADVLNPSQALSRVYQKNPSGARVHLYIAYFRRQRQNGKLLDYRTAALYEGASKVKIRTAGGQTFVVNGKVIRSGQDSRAIYFWYVLNGRILAGRPEVFEKDLLNAVIRGKDNGTFIMVSADTTKDLDAFASKLVPVAGQFIR